MNATPLLTQLSIGAEEKKTERRMTVSEFFENVFCQSASVKHHNVAAVMRSVSSESMEGREKHVQSGVAGRESLEITVRAGPMFSAHVTPVQILCCSKIACESIPHLLANLVRIELNHLSSTPELRFAMIA